MNVHLDRAVEEAETNIGMCGHAGRINISMRSECPLKKIVERMRP